MRLRAGEYFGRLAARRDVGGVHLNERVYAPRLAIPRHTHERAHVVLVVGGGYEERTRRGSVRYSTSSALVHPAGEEHEDHFGPSGGRTFQVELDRPLAAVRASEELFAVVRALREELHSWDAVSPLAVEGLALQLEAEVTRARHTAPSDLARAIEYVEAHFREPLRLADVARASGLSPRRLVRLLRTSCRCTLADYVRRRRVEYARRLLLQTKSSIAQIAAAAGFADHAHLTRSFRRYLGTVPSAYRRG
jgi:AraC family transcriptional regulator